MKLVYMCRLGFKNGRLRDRPLIENEGLSKRPLKGKKQGILELKITKKRIFFKTRVFFLPRSERRYKELYVFEKGVFWGGPGRKSRGFRSGKGRKMRLYTCLKYLSLLKRLYGVKERRAMFLVTSPVFMT